MERKEKIEFILEQMRLCLAKKDYIRTQIISKKINTKFFEEKTTTVSYSIVWAFVSDSVFFWFTVNNRILVHVIHVVLFSTSIYMFLVHVYCM